MSDKTDYQMQGRPRLLDLFCGAGGAARGYQWAGFHVTGVDIAPQPRYAGDVFILADALEYLARHGHEYDVIHASPPCQKHSILRNIHTIRQSTDANYVDLIAPIRALLKTSDRAYVIENVPGAPLENPVMLCGSQFGLKVYRHRLFESNFLLFGIPHYPHADNTPSSGHGISSKGFISVTGNGGAKGLPIGTRYMDYAGAAMGIDWMSRSELSEAIPPAYTDWIGRQVLEGVRR